jgi:hypothetical protein
MKYFSYILIFIQAILLIDCRKDNDVVIEEITDDCFLLSDLRTNTNHLLPFKLYNDIDSGLNKIYLNNEELDLHYGHSLVFSKSGFFELIIVHTGNATERDTILFTLGTDERQAAEWGIEAWTPVMFSTTRLVNETVQCISPGKYAEGIDIPFLFYVSEGDSIQPVYAQGECRQNSQQFSIKRGVGSVLVNSEEISGSVLFNIGGNIMEKNITPVSVTMQQLTGDISDDVIIPANALVKITGDLHILPDASLSVGNGVILLIDEAVNIVNEGPIIFAGDLNNPILVTCSEREKYWGGFISNGAGATVSAEYTFFCHSGYHQGGEYAWGHAQCQALFFTNQSTLNLDNCYILDNIGQIFYPQASLLNLKSILVQRAKTGGQINYSTVSIQDCIFTDFPDDSQVYRDADNDAIYINASDVTIDHSVFMFAKDDGMDSGLNEGGTVTVTNSRFEACFHEGAALSSQNSVVKTHSFLNCTFYNCGQGLELGFSSPNHHVIADHCRFLNNYIGIRYGDNYDWSIVEGSMLIKNSQSLNNVKDVWNMVRMIWAPRLDHLQFENTQVSAYQAQYPGLEIISQ